GQGRCNGTLSDSRLSKVSGVGMQWRVAVASAACRSARPLISRGGRTGLSGVPLRGLHVVSCEKR
ncbi:MAG: hypothetical protein MUF20_12060, partial [Methylotetracoccus sp.]|nr:hypothetical protein [Methylotetracoccus sp.]